MTLKEAYEIQCKELWSLRAEVRRLKSGTFTSDEKKALEKTIREQTLQIQWLTKELEICTRKYELVLKEKESLSKIVYGDYENL